MVLEGKTPAKAYTSLHLIFFSLIITALLPLAMSFFFTHRAESELLKEEELNLLTEKLKSTEINLQSIREEEKKYMDELHTVYKIFLADFLQCMEVLLQS
mgnify:CR=1 FL=1